MMQGFIDAAFVILFALVQPALGFQQAPRMRRILEAQNGLIRRAVYNQVMMFEWALAALGALIWLAAGRSLAALGATAPMDWRLFGSLAFVALATLLLALLARAAVQGNQRALAYVRRRTAQMRFFLPHDRRDLRRFLWLSLTAGVCEELLYRGWLIWWLGQLMPIWTAVAASALVFAAAHASYQDARGLAGVLLAGLVFGALFALTGSLIPAILMHIAVDMTSGVAIWAALRDGGAAAQPSYSPP